MLLFVNTSFAQQICNDEIIMAVKGKWKKHSDANMQMGNQSQIISRLDKMQQVIQAAYPEPRGIEAGWSRSMGGYFESLNKNSVAYDLNIMFFSWYCNSHVKKLLLGGEASSSLNIWANKFKWFASKNEDFTIDSNPVYLLTKKTGDANGFTVFEGNDNGTRNTGTTFSKTILISRPGQLPYTTINRNKYLTVFLKNKAEAYRQSKEGLLKRKVRSEAEEEVYKNQQIEKEVNKPGNELVKEKAKSNFLRGYTTERQRLQKDLDNEEERYQKDIQAANDYLKSTSAAELNKPAYVENTSYSYSFKKFGNEKDGRAIVQVNNNYFNIKLPAYVPQFLVVYWYWNTEKASLDFDSQIEKNLDFKLLQAMLDK
ncbi:MAG: hypothetical protein ABIP30_15580 [Ferruginibacter sp.]